MFYIPPIRYIVPQKWLAMCELPHNDLRWRYDLFLDTGHFVHAYRRTSLAMYGTMVPLAYVAAGV